MDAKQFCSIWQRAKTIDEVIEKTGMTKMVVSQKASIMRTKRGIELQFFPSQRGRDWEGLAEEIAAIKPGVKPGTVPAKVAKPVTPKTAPKKKATPVKVAPKKKKKATPVKAKKVEEPEEEELEPEEPEVEEPEDEQEAA